MKARLSLILALFLVGAVLAGCGANGGTPLSPASGTSGAGSDQAGVTQAMAAAPELIDDGQFESGDQTGLDPGSAGGTAAINPLFFYRRITSVARTFEFTFADTDTSGRPTTAIVTVHKRLLGSFNVATGVRPEAGTLDTAQLRIVRKPLDDRWVRRLLFRRVPAPPGDHDGDDPGARWRLAASSGVDVTSRGATTQIVSLEIKTATRDTLLTDPLAFFRLRRLMKFDAGDQVTLIVTTGRNDDVVVLLRGGLRAKFANNGDNTYTAQWRVRLLDGVQHVGVNALSHGTLFDDEAPYDSKAWIVPYLVSPTELAELIP